jgi:hypothetical protein
VKWRDLPQSDNVEVDCLGERTPLKSPEAAAAFACQDEVSNLRDQFAQGDPARGQQFDKALILYLKNSDGTRTPQPLTMNDVIFSSRNLANLAERPPNFEELVKNFKRELDGFLILADMEANGPIPPERPKGTAPIPPRRPDTQPEARVPLPPRRPSGL